MNEARSAVLYLVALALKCYTKALKRASKLDALERTEAHCAWLETAYAPPIKNAKKEFR